MIIATLRTNNRNYTIEVIDAFATGDGRRIAAVAALPVDGKPIRPFTEITHGGPCQSSTARIPATFLSNISEIEP